MKKRRPRRQQQLIRLDLGLLIAKMADKVETPELAMENDVEGPKDSVRAFVDN
jgi:hypothetical protein